jgi:hypothetical protein
MYQKYYLEKKRGFTDAEFRSECENAAGASLAELFSYASTSKAVDYARYFALAGLRIRNGHRGCARRLHRFVHAKSGDPAE